MSFDGTGFSKNENLSPYELRRLVNVQLVEKELGGTNHVSVNNSAKGLVNSNGKQKLKENTRRKRTIKQKSQTEFVRRSTRTRTSSKKKLAYNEEESDSIISDNDENPPKKRRRLGSKKVNLAKNETNQKPAKKIIRQLNDSDFYSDDEIVYMEYRPKGERGLKRVPVNVPVNKITQEMLDNVYYFSTGKRYGPDGTCCHQCRQKTLDQKTFCRSKRCIGLQGMFCGCCLSNRYGEKVSDALLQNKWICPPCRGRCNCSACRTKDGKSPTGQLALIARKQGFNSVEHFLQATEGKKPKSFNGDEEE